MKKKIEFRFAHKQEKEKLANFIEMYFKKDHIYLKSQELLDYDFFYANSSNFYIATIGEQIIAVIGIIPYSCDDKKDIFTSMWMTDVNNTASPVIGFQLFLELVKMNYKSINAVSFRDELIPFYHRLGFKVDKLKHYYIKNINLPDKIAKTDYTTLQNNQNIKHKSIYDFYLTKEFISRDEFDQLNKNTIKKSYDYFVKRYKNHPFYSYKTFLSKSRNTFLSILVMRESSYFDSKVLRIIDFVGDINTLIGQYTFFQKIMRDYEYEYIDFMNYGIDEYILFSAGFKLVDADEIVPNYFEPFVQENIPLNFFTTYDLDKVWMFKGDGDQDRPNQLKEQKWK